MTHAAIAKASKTPVDPRQAALHWLANGIPVAIATVVETWGSAPVPAGGQMVIAGEDAFQGSVSGGCVEADVVTAALDVLSNGRPQTLAFGVADETAWRAGLACGGRIRVQVSRLDAGGGRELLSAIDAAAAARHPIAVSLRLDDGVMRVVSPSDPHQREIAAALALGQSRLLDTQDGEIFIHAITPPIRIAIIGATHIAQILTGLAQAIGYAVLVIDPRSAFTSTTRFDGDAVSTSWPDAHLEDLSRDPFTAIVTLTHVDHIDDEALSIALTSPCRYIGALGSRKTMEKRAARLKAAGFSDGDIARIQAPIGMNIGAKSPGEIAVSILAQIIAAFRKSSAA